MTAPAPELTFEDAEYIPSAGGPGRTKEPNPFAGIIADIALQTKERDGKTVPVAKSYVFEYEPGNEDDKTRKVNQLKRQLSNAGAENTPQVTVRSEVTDVVNPVNKQVSNKKARLVFWTVPRQNRPRSGASTASTPQSVAVTEN